MLDALAIVVFGFSIGILTGFLGVSGGFIIMPSLLLLGVPAHIAVGTSLLTLTLGVCLAVIRHVKMGNTNFKLGFIVSTGASIGMFLGVTLVEKLKHLKNLDILINLSYMIILYTIALYSLRESISTIKNKHNALRDDEDERRNYSFSLTKSLVIGVLVGLLSGFLGTGGGFLYIPLFTYVLKVATPVAVGTSLLTILISGIPGTLTHAICGNVNFVIALLFFIGMSIGTQVGAVLTKQAGSLHIRLMYSSCTGLTALSLTFRIIASYLIHSITLLKISQMILICGVVLISITILILGFIKKLHKSF